MIWTIGYQRLAPSRLLELAERLDALVIDVRAVPKTRIKGYGTRQLETLLGRRYLWAGSVLGGRGHGGKVTEEGIKAVERSGRDGNVILMCVCHVPGDCHRHQDICAPHFPKAIHIFEDEAIEAGELDRSIRQGGDYMCEDLDEAIAAASSGS